MLHTSKHVTGTFKTANFQNMKLVIPAVLWNIGNVSNPGVSQDIQFRICHTSGKDVSVLDMWQA